MFNIGKPPPKKFDTSEPIPTGEVTEGNDEADWAAWEDSVAFQDSQMPDFQGSVTVSESASPKPQSAPPDAPAKSAGPAVEVVEGNDESHWAQWEDSVMFQDSQLQDPQATATAPKKPTVDDSAEHVDIFSSVHKNSA